LRLLAGAEAAVSAPLSTTLVRSCTSSDLFAVPARALSPPIVSVTLPVPLVPTRR